MAASTGNQSPCPTFASRLRSLLMKAFVSARQAVIGLLALPLVAVSCGGQATNEAATSPAPEVIGTATLSETGCEFAAPDRLPLHPVTIELVNNTRYSPGRFILVRVRPGHTFQDLVDYVQSGQQGTPDFITEVSLVDVPSSGSRQMTTQMFAAGVYALHCGYPNDAGKVVGFLRGPMHAGTP